ncbi:MAG: ester cyclase [Lachnospiraceae bacterium]|nr:ester cyclase [Lachnospiraceae bacterium]
MEVEILDLIEEDNKVAIRARFTGTHNAEVYDCQPAGKRISFEALEIFRIENGLIVESWGYWPDMNIREMLIKND